MEFLQIATHNGTHLDAPYHFHSTMNNGERAITIDEVPLEWCLNPGVKLDFRHFDDGYVVTAKDVEAELQRIEHDLQPLDIVVINTAAGSHYGQDDYLLKGCGMGREATLYLTEKGVRVTGTDAWSWDAPFAHTRRCPSSHDQPFRARPVLVVPPATCVSTLERARSHMSRATTMSLPWSPNTLLSVPTHCVSARAPPSRMLLTPTTPTPAALPCRLHVYVHGVM